MLCSSWVVLNAPVIYLISLAYSLTSFHAEYKQAVVVSCNLIPVIVGYYSNCQTDGLMDSHPLPHIIAVSACFKRMMWQARQEVV